MINTSFTRKSLQLGISTAALLIGMSATPAFAQAAPTSPAVTSTDGQATTATPPDQSAAGTDGTADVVVTGTLFRSAAATPASITSLSAADLEQRGINTAQEAIQRLSANGAGALPNNFSAAGAFAQGASGVSLRGLGTSSTLVLFDGLRASYYPLADDGVRNFVDLNTIPDAIIEKIDVLKEGASSTYGADAVAGVVNVILKKQIKGYHLNGSAGISQRGDAGEQRIDATAGWGDVQENGYNFYINGEYQNNDPLFSRDRGYPYNTADFSRLCGAANGNNTSFPAGSTVCRTNGVSNGVQFNGVYTGFAATNLAAFRPYNATTSTPIAGSRYLYGQTCSSANLQLQQLTAAQLGTTAGATAPLGGACLQDNRNLYNQISPKQERIGGTAHLTMKVGDSAQAYAAFTYYQSKVASNSGTPRSLSTATSAVGNPPTSVTVNALILPIYVCSAGVGTFNTANGQNVSTGCTAANGVFNPNNPFAALGQTARVVGLVSDVPFRSEAFSQTYRGAVGIDGSFGNDWHYNVDAVAMRTDLKYTSTGYPNLQNLFTAVAQGTYNFVNPAANSQAIRDFVIPTAVGHFNSQLHQVQASLSHGIFDLPGGPLLVAVGASARHESVYAPSRNPLGSNPLDRTGLNAFGAVGNRNVESAFFEVNAPVIEQFVLDGSGRYDHYSTSQSNFSPKIGGIFKPIRQVSFFANYSKGFRIGSFAETSGSPTTGFITVDAPAAFQAAHGNTGSVASGVGYSLGLTTISNLDLKPEKSTNFNAGVTVEPVRWFSAKASYYYIEKKGGITFPNYKPILAQYYAAAQGTIQPGQTLTYAGGWTVVAGAQDVNAPNANPTPAFIAHTLENAAVIKTMGLDFAFDLRFPITDKLKLTSSFDATHVIRSYKVNADGTVERYDGSLGPYQITSASGTPKWRGSIQNTIEYGPASLSGTVYYTSGYHETAEDNGGRFDDGTCLSGIGSGTPATYRDNATPVVCRVKHFIDVDLTASLRVNENFKLYGNVLNLFNVSAPYDPTTYGGSNYNPAWASAGVLGRYLRVGAKVDF